ncbi:MAG: helix-turn-helix domain-containing protein [Bacilli bacterium]
MPIIKPKMVEVVNEDGTISLVEEKPKKKLSKIERKKLRVITKLIEGEINGTQAAKKLGLTTRQIRNLKRQVLEEGRDGVIHKNKNYKPYNTYDAEISTFVCKLYRREYRGTNFSEFARIVQAQYGIQASRSTIYNFLRRGHIRSPQRKTKKKKVVVVENATTQNNNQTTKVNSK